MTLGGSFFVYRGVDQDYCFIEALNCLDELCDEIAIVCGGDDGTVEAIKEWSVASASRSRKTSIEIISKRGWDEVRGQTKLSFFTNRAIEMLSTDWVINLQADEIIHENCFMEIRTMIHKPGAEAFMCKRINLWACPYTYLEVDQSRKPVSTEIFRLAKRKYRAYDDAEQLAVEHGLMPSHDINFYHMGFVRDKYKHITKINHMQKEVFLWDVDKRIHDNVDGFDPWRWGFTPNDLKAIHEPLPKFIRAWAKEREPIIFRKDDHGYKMATIWFASMAIVTSDVSDDRDFVIDEANELWYRLAKAHT